MKNILLLVFTSVCLVCSGHPAELFLEAESFADKGGWVLDQQFMDQMGSPYLMAHGLGKVVADARTTVEFPETGTYRLWVRTFNWTAPWYKGAGPGQFKLKINGKAHPVVLGNTGKQWMWQDAGKVSIKNKQTEITLQDLTGFNGRCDAIFFTKDESFVPPSDIQTLSDFRRNKLNITIQDAGHYDLVVIGGGVAGVCAAVSAAQLGVKVALINNRPVLGGNSSSEVRVGISGRADANLYPNIGNVLKKILMTQHANGGPAEIYTDSEKAALVKNTPNLDVFPNLHVFKTEMNRTTITAVVARHIENSAEFRFEATWFADCTGDATVGYLAGADYRMGRESAYEAFESLAPRIADNAMTGTSNLWSYETVSTPSSFPLLEWACQFNPDFYIESDKDWRWEGGFAKNTITDAENIRDQNFRAIFGNWSYLKNNNPKFANRQISWLAYLAGKRESRRLLGDVILNQTDVQNQVKYNDASFTTTWSLDLHYPDWKASKYFPGEEFFSYCVQTPIYPYHVPYRCLYSRNINNLFMAGRNISATHVAFGTIRVQVTTGMMGEVVGMAASVCKKYKIMPRQVYTEHLADLKTLMKTGVPLTANQYMQSPNGEASATLAIDKNGLLCYHVSFNGKNVIDSSPMGIIIDGDTLGQNVSMKLLDKTLINETYKTRGFHTDAVNHAIQYTYQVQSSKKNFLVQFRLQDDGVAFRYIVPGDGRRLVNGETTTFRVPRNTPVWFFERTSGDWKLKSYAGEWRRTQSDSLCVISPNGPVQGAILLYELPNEKYMGITEAALYNYSGMRFEAKADASLQAHFTEGDKGFQVEGEITTPWRVILLADNLNELVNSDFISNLNPSPDTKFFPDTDWIKPGRSVWSFFSSFRKDYYVTLPFEKHFIDRASELTFEYTLIDEDWETKWENKWKDLRELCAYARKKNVSVMVWKHSNQLDNPQNNYEQMRVFLDSIKAAGAVGIKIDFMNGETKQIIDFDIRALQLCAERRLLLDFHGCQKPSGESRTYPNEITREGIRGLELNRMNQPIPGNHNVALVFTRCILNNADYTPVSYSNPGPTSWAHQLATAYAFTSPLLVFAEHPDTLFLNKTIAATLPLIKTIPTVWDETIVLPKSSVAETAILARRSGYDWYLVVLNGNRPKQLNVKTDFLKEGKWNVLMVKDDAARQDNMIVEERILYANESLSIHLNYDGGYVAKFSQKNNF